MEKNNESQERVIYKGNIEVYNPSKSNSPSDKWEKSLDSIAESHGLACVKRNKEPARGGNRFYFIPDIDTAQKFREDIIKKDLAQTAPIYIRTDKGIEIW